MIKDQAIMSDPLLLFNTYMV